ncbi:MAG TPA: winged helix-turn-helix domain-containing protein [Thermoanaerobaculia bacterium]
MKRVAIIGGDLLFVRRAQRIFEAEGFEAEAFDEVGVAIRQTFDLIVFEIDAASLDVVRQFRSDSAIITVSSDASLHADALAAGADESVLKTTGARELIARANAVLRRASVARTTRPAYEDEEVAIYLDALSVVHGGRQTSLSKGEADVLALLIRNGAAPLSVERIRQEVSIRSELSRSAIEARLKGLRRKIGPDLIANRPGFGYCFQPRQRRRA